MKNLITKRIGVIYIEACCECPHHHKSGICLHPEWTNEFPRKINDSLNRPDCCPLEEIEIDEVQ